MKVFAYLGLVVLSLSPMPAFAADITATDAKSIETQFSNFLPPALRSILKLLPAGDHFDAHVDLGALADTEQMPLHISKMTPIAGTITPRADGLWDIASHGDMVLMGHILLGADNTHFNVKTGDYQINAIYDPAHGYPQSGEMHSQHWKFSTESYRESRDVSADDYDIKYAVTGAKAGRIDSQLKLTAHNVWEKLTNVSLSGKDLEIFGASVNSTESVTGVDLATAKQIIELLVGSGALFPQALNQAQQAEISDILKQNPLLFSAFDEKTEISKPKFKYDRYEVSAASANFEGKLTYGEHGGDLVFNFSAEKPLLQPGAFPHPVDLAMPDKVVFGLHFGDLKIQNALSEIFTSASLGDDPQSKDWVSRILSHNDKVRIEFTDTSLHSQYYDVSLSGSFAANIKQRDDRPDVDLTITAHNLDKAVSFLQANANTVPWFGQASFVLLMAKGMSKQQSDGAFVWHIQADANGRPLINGHAFGH